MAVVSPSTESTGGVAPEPPGPLLRLFGAICSIPSVRRVGITLDGGPLDLWVFTQGETEEDEQRIYLHVRAYRAVPSAAALDLHLIPLDEVDESLLPPVDILFER
jgi:hypothetical protein